jgi:hypothetical protein
VDIACAPVNGVQYVKVQQVSAMYVQVVRKEDIPASLSQPCRVLLSLQPRNLAACYSWDKGSSLGM